MPKFSGYNDHRPAFTVGAEKFILSGRRAGSKGVPGSKYKARGLFLPRVMRSPWIFSVGALCCVWNSPSARAQQALFSTLSLDSILQAQQQAALLAEANTNPVVNLPPAVPHLGPVLWNLGVYSSLAYDDNIYLSRNNQESDLILGDGLNLGLNWQATGRSALQLNSQLGYYAYFQHPDFNYIQISPGSALTWTFSLSDWDFTLFDQFNYSRSVVAVASVSNLGGIPLLDNTAGARAQWHPGPWLLETGYSYDYHLATTAQYNYLSFGSDYLYARGGWRFSPNGTVGVESSVSVTDYAQPVQPNSTSYSLGPYLEWQLDPAIHLSLHGGPTYYAFAATSSGAAQNNLTSYYVSLELTHKLNPFLSEDLTINRSVSPSFYQGSGYTEQLNVAYSANWYPKPWLYFSLGLNYQSGQQPLQESMIVNIPPFGPVNVITPFTENFSRYGFNFGAYYQLTQKINAGLNYAHWTRGSNIAADEYNDDQITLQLRYDF